MSRSLETIAAAAILDYLISCPHVIIHAWHPPSSKAYFGPLIRIPKKRDGQIIRNRYHIDGIIQIDSCLLLIELKGNGKDLSSDVCKLQELMSTYSLREVVDIMRQRVYQHEDLSFVDCWIPAFGYCHIKEDMSFPGVCFSVKSDNRIDISINASVPESISMKLREALCDQSSKQ